MNTISISFLFLLLILPLQITKSLSSATRDAQVEALLTWKKSLLSSSTILPLWSLSNRENLCNDWDGIFSCNSDETVSELYLAGLNLTGTLEKFNFTLFQNLTSLDMSDNYLNGSIPSDIGKLTELQYLTLWGNQFNGTIPYQISYLKKLLELRLHSNKLQSAEWSKFQSMPLLTYINLRNNLLTGKFPDFLLKSPNLTHLYMSSNKFNGFIPESLFTIFEQLESLYISHNSFEGTFSSFFTKLPKLLNIQFIYLGNNLLEGEIPSSIGQFKNLSELDLSHNLLTGNLPFSLSNLSNLVRLYLHDNKFSGAIPSDIGNCKLLYDLQLRNNNLIGNIPSSLCEASTLNILDLSLNKLKGNIPQCLGNTYLKYLMLNSNQLEGSLPQTLVNCSSLEILDVGNNLINDSFPEWIETLPILQVLGLRSNKFHGSIPSSKTKSPFSKLKIFDIANNKLTGLLPIVYFEHFEAMVNVSISEETLKNGSGRYYDVTMTVRTKGGEHPQTPMLRIFVSIDVSNNNFQGKIPSSIGRLKSLKLLNVSHNNLTGQIPLSLRKLSNLETLDLSLNKLVGRIPSELADLTFLSVLNLSYNDLNGSIPRGGQFSFDNKSYIGNFDLCGFPLTKKCEMQELPTLPKEEDENSSSLFDRDAALVGYACGTVVGIAIGSLLLSYGKIKWIDRISNKQHRRRPIRAY